MKKFLLFGAAVLMTLSVSAQSITKVWTATNDGTLRSAVNVGETLFVFDATNGVIQEWKDGVKGASYDIKAYCAENEIGHMVDAVQKDENGDTIKNADGTPVTVPTFSAYTPWTAITADEAGNVLINVGNSAGGSKTCQNWLLLPAGDRTAIKWLNIDTFEDITGGSAIAVARVDIPSRVVGDITGDGAYLMLPTVGSALGVVYAAMDEEGELYYDPEASWALLSAVAFNSNGAIATTCKFDDIADASEENDFAGNIYYCTRGANPASWSAENCQFETNASMVKAGNSAGFAMFTIGEKTYYVQAENTGTRTSSAVQVVDLETNTIVATWEPAERIDYYIGSITAEANADGETATIGICAHKANSEFGLLKFDPKGSSAIEEIAADNAAVEYYNLQGVKVANPENGIFVKKQGAKATKVVL